MKKIHLIGLALAAVLAFGAIVANAASALEWLVDGEPIPAGGSVESTTEGLLFLTDLNALGAVVTIHCEGKFDGLLLPEGLDTVEQVLNAAGELISSTPLAGLALSCTVTKEHGGCVEGSLAEVWPENLTWSSQLEFEALPEMSWDHLGEAGKEPAYESVCTNILGGTTTDLCEGLVRALLVNMGTPDNDVLGSYSWADSGTTNCTVGGTGAGMIATGEAGTEGEGGLIFVTGKSLAVS